LDLELPVGDFALSPCNRALLPCHLFLPFGNLLLALAQDYRSPSQDDS
jgi:hypothetical protein